MAKPPLPSFYKAPEQSQDPSSNDLGKTRLMEKKQQQWKMENGRFLPTTHSPVHSLPLAEKAPVWNPFGRPGAGAPNANEMLSRMPVSNSSSFVSPHSLALTL